MINTKKPAGVGKVKLSIAKTVIVFSVLAMSLPAWAKVDPLRVISERMLRSEILIVLDTSGSMHWYPNPSWSVGTDCGGNRTGSVDLCGDGMCSGNEGSSANQCPQDCPVDDNGDAEAGMPPVCKPGYAYPSRMFMVKRVLRNLLPDLRQVASLGLVTFKQYGYFRYYQADTKGYWTKEKKKVQVEVCTKKWKKIKKVKTCTKKWNKKKKKWVTKCKWTWEWGWVTTCTTKWQWKWVNVFHPAKAKKVSLFISRTEMEQIGAWESDLEKPEANFTLNGTKYTLLSGAGLQVTKDSLYSRQDDPSLENRFRFDLAGVTHSDGFHTWNYRGSYYTYDQGHMNSSSYKVFDKYKGPQFVDGNGQTWIYHRFNYEYTSQGINAQSAGLVQIPLTTGTDQAAHDAVLFSILNRMNLATNGGIWSRGNTPTGPAIQTAEQHYLQRQSGTGPFGSVGSDPAANCRPRFVLLLTDGQSNVGTKPYYAARDLYKNPQFSTNQIKTLVVGLPGLPSSAITELDRTADMGDDGKENQSKTAYYAQDEATLVKVIKEAFLEMLKGDYTTTAPGVTSSGDTYISGDLALLSSTEYPGWKGHLRSMDLTQDPAAEYWDAGTLLKDRDYKTRILFTGWPNTNKGLPVALMDSDGTVNLAAVKQVWSEAGTPPADTDIAAVVEWLAGKDRTWKLGSLIRSAPATVGKPPWYNLKGHNMFRKKHANRERLIYVTSNEGLLHAFRAQDGSEAFGYVPPNLWPKIHTLWKQGGQPTDPTKVLWVLASSPRVEDIPPQSVPGDWSTQLVLTMGPGDKAFLSLDITTPSTCTGIGCKLKEHPFRILAHSRNLNMSSTLGETWSVPSLFYAHNESGELTGRMAMGNGYGASGQGKHYYHFPKMMGAPESNAHASSGAEVDFAVLPHTTAAINKLKERRIIATYQGDLRGRLVRYQEGDAQKGETIIDAGAKSPFYFSPAVYALEGNDVLLAAVSSSDKEESPAANSEATLFLRADKNGEIDQTSQMTCKAKDICSQSIDCPSEVPKSCKAPSERAVAVGAPMMLKNNYDKQSTQHEAFFLLYDPPTDICSMGDTWLVRLAADSTGAKLVSATKYEGIRASGMALVGGSTDLAITQIGTGGNMASAFTVINKTLDPAAGSEAPMIEAWREVGGH